MIRKPKSGSGCGTGCLSLIIIMVLFFAGSYFFIKDRLDSLNKIDESERKLEIVYGSIYEFTPELDVKYNADRIQKFLEVRSLISKEMNELDSAMSGIQSEIEDVKDDPSIWDIITIVKSGFELIPEIVQYYMARNDALMKTHMGLGEYLFIYNNAYFVMLGKSPSDGPKFRLEGENDDVSDRYGEKVFEERFDKISKKINTLGREHLTNLKNLLEKTDPSNKNIRLIEEEISSLFSNRNKIPWSEKKPEFIKAPFNNYLAQLDSSYRPLLNPLEIIETKD